MKSNLLVILGMAAAMLVTAGAANAQASGGQGTNQSGTQISNPPTEPTPQRRFCVQTGSGIYECYYCTHTNIDNQSYCLPLGTFNKGED